MADESAVSRRLGERAYRLQRMVDDLLFMFDRQHELLDRTEELLITFEEEMRLTPKT